MTLDNNIFYIKYLKNTSCFYSLGIRLFGRSYIMTHKRYDNIVGISLALFTLFAPVLMVALFK